MTDTCSCPDCADDLPDDTSVLCFRLPDELSGVMDGDDALAVATIAVQDRLFARVLLPVPLDSSHRLCFSIWLSLPPGEAERVRSAWDRPGLVLVGTIANELPLWGLRGLPVLAARRDEPGGPPDGPGEHSPRGGAAARHRLAHPARAGIRGPEPAPRITSGSPAGRLMGRSALGRAPSF